MTESVIRAKRLRQCPLCDNRERGILCTGLRDRLFGAPGEWIFNRCCRCGVAFLDPQPTLEDIEKAYATYYTHSPNKPSNSILHRMRRYVRSGYLAIKFGYTEGVSSLQRLAGLLAYLHPGQREVMNLSVMYLHARRRGRLLEVGFGSGEKLAELRRLGWEVEGVDFDVQAVEGASRKYGLDVRGGTLADQCYPADRYDAVVMSHVIEHVHNPKDLLAECLRVLKPGGLLVIATPNLESLLSRHFRCSWYHLDPPRHLILFSINTLSRLLDIVGARIESVRTTVGSSARVLAASREIRARGSYSWQNGSSREEKILGSVYQYIAAAALGSFPGTGDELVVIATKDK